MNEAQIQTWINMYRDSNTRIDALERRIQMLTDSFVVSGIWRNTSSLEHWAKQAAMPDGPPLQFNMTDD